MPYCFQCLTLPFSVTSSIRHYCCECSNHIAVRQACCLRYIARLISWGCFNEVSLTITNWLVATHKGRWDNVAASTTRAEHAAAYDLPEDPPLRKATFDGWRNKHYFEFVEHKKIT